MSTHEESKTFHAMTTYEAHRRSHKAWIFCRGELLTTAWGKTDSEALASAVANARTAIRCDRASRAAARHWKAPPGKPIESCSDLFESFAESQSDAAW
jgi:hypothetical protein